MVTVLNKGCQAHCEQKKGTVLTFTENFAILRGLLTELSMGWGFGGQRYPPPGTIFCSNNCHCGKTNKRTSNFSTRKANTHFWRILHDIRFTWWNPTSMSHDPVNLDCLLQSNFNYIKGTLTLTTGSRQDSEASKSGYNWIYVESTVASFVATTSYRSHNFFSVFFAVFLAVFFAICKKYR